MHAARRLSRLVFFSLTASLLTWGCSTSSSQSPDQADDTHEAAHPEAHAKHAHAEHDHAKHGDKGPRGHRFTEPEAYAERWNDPGRDAWQKPGEVLSLLGVAPGMTVVDLGTGTGYFVPHLAEAVGAAGSVWALDVEQSMLTYVEEQIIADDLEQATAKLVAYDDPQLGAATVDRLITVNTWHHIRDREAYGAKLREALKPGGALAVIDYDVDNDFGPSRDHKLSADVVVAELEAAGLVAEIVEEDLPRQYMVIARKAAD